MLLAFYILSALLITVNLLPFISHQHWMFRVWEFGRIQVMFLQIILLVMGILLLQDKALPFWDTVLIHAGLVVNNVIIFIPYTTVYKKNSKKIFRNIPTLFLLYQ